jgi:hypothetical protein
VHPASCGSPRKRGPGKRCSKHRPLRIGPAAEIGCCRLRDPVGNALSARPAAQAPEPVPAHDPAGGSPVRSRKCDRTATGGMSSRTARRTGPGSPGAGEHREVRGRVPAPLEPGTGRSRGVGPPADLRCRQGPMCTHATVESDPFPASFRVEASGVERRRLSAISSAFHETSICRANVGRPPEIAPKPDEAVPAVRRRLVRAGRHTSGCRARASRSFEVPMPAMAQTVSAAP